MDANFVEREFDMLLQRVAAYYRISVEQILRPDRTQHLARARMVVAYLGRDLLQMSYPTIGRKLGNRDHTTILHSYTKISKLLESNHQLRQDIEMLRSSVNLPPPPPPAEPVEEVVNQPPKILTREEKILAMSPSGERDLLIVKLWDNGWSLGAIGNRTALTRERIRQIIDRTLLIEIQTLLLQGRKVNIDAYLARRKSNHSSAIETIVRREKTERKKELVELRRKRDAARQIRQQKWSLHYDKCGICGTTKIRHRVWGYCEKCFVKSPEFKQSVKKSNANRIEQTIAYRKEYYKRPEVIARIDRTNDDAHFSGNRIKALMRDGYRCTNCSMSRDESMAQFGTDLYVRRLNEKSDNSLENLVTACRKCFLKFTSARNNKRETG